MPIVVQSQEKCESRAIGVICQWGGQFRWSINRDPCPLILAHSFQLASEYPGRDDSGHSREESKNRGGTKNNNRYLFAFAAMALLGMATAAIGIYCICYCGDPLLALGVICEVIGGAVFIGGIASVIGIAFVYN
jgi:hypothetical protein